MTGFGAIRVGASHPAVAASWSMARPRDSARYHRRLLLSGLLLTALLAGGIHLGNAVTVLRREVQDLARQNRNLEARQAQLAVRWNTQTSRQVILRRAGRELGLIVHEAPAAILVSHDDADGRSRGPLRLGPLDPVPVARAATGEP